MTDSERESISSFAQFLLLPKPTERHRNHPYGTPVDKEEWLPASVAHSESMTTEYTETVTTDAADDSRASSEVTENDDAESQVTDAKTRRPRQEVKRPSAEVQPLLRRSSILRSPGSVHGFRGFRRTVSFARENTKRMMASVAQSKGKEDVPKKSAVTNGESERRSSLRTPQTEGNSGGSQAQGERRPSKLATPVNQGASSSGKTMLSPEQEKPVGQRPRRDSYMSEGSIYIGE